jgi:hypothetical protein
VCVKLFSVTATVETDAGTPATLIVDGYKAAAPNAGIVIAAELLNETGVPFEVVPSWNVYAIVPWFVAPSCSWKVAVTVPPHGPLATNVNGFTTGGAAAFITP